jgi:cAMP-dependent protein kinase regulator
LDWKEEEILIKSMAEKEFKIGDKVIQEGDSGDELFIVESGEYDCFKIIDGQDTYLKSYKYGEAFGELALMYNAPRAASIVCKAPGKLYALGRQAFSQVVKESAAKKRELYKNVLGSIELFSSMDDHSK